MLQVGAGRAVRKLRGRQRKQSAKLDTDAFAYFAYYDPNNWVGRVTATGLSSDKTTGVVTLAQYATWDASCVLTGVLASQTCDATNTPGLTNPMDPTKRVILTYNGTAGAAFEWGSLTADQQAALTLNETATTVPYRLNYLRGDRTDEINSAGTCKDAANTPCFRARTSVLGDIVDSSPTWVGPPAVAVHRNLEGRPELERLTE